MSVGARNFEVDADVIHALLQARYYEDIASVGSPTELGSGSRIIADSQFGMMDLWWVPAPISPGEKSLGCTRPSANPKKGLGIVELIATILVVAFLLYMVWPWLWHIATTLALALLVYIALPWFWQSKSWEDFKARLQQIEVSQQKAPATNTSSGRVYYGRLFSPQRTQESRIHFEELGQKEYPRPYPRPILVRVDRRRGVDVLWWKGECWFLRHNEEPYRFLCVVHGRLQWC